MLSGQSHLHNGVHFKFSLAHWQRKQRPLQVHLISSLQTVETLGMVIQTGCHWLLSPLTHVLLWEKEHPAIRVPMKSKFLLGILSSEHAAEVHPEI